MMSQKWLRVKGAAKVVVKGQMVVDQVQGAVEAAGDQAEWDEAANVQVVHRPQLSTSVSGALSGWQKKLIDNANTVWKNKRAFL